MAEAALIFSIITASASLAMKCGEVAKTLNDITAKYKKAELSMSLLLQQIDTIKAAWERISAWSTACQERLTATGNDTNLLGRLDRSLKCGNLVVSALEDDLKAYKFEGGLLTFRQRSKLVWNDDTIQNHQTRVRDQVATMTLLLQVLNL